MRIEPGGIAMNRSNEASRVTELLRSPVGLLKFLFTQRLLRPAAPSEIGLDDVAKREFLRRLGLAHGYLEFGSGGSTLAAAKAGVRAISVEGDPVYARVVQRTLGDTPNLEIIHVDIGLTREWSRPVVTWRSKERLRKWRAYIEVPFARLAGWFPDFVLVDGRFRKACVLQTARQAMLLQHPVTIMVDDYFDTGRQHYHEVEQWVGHPQRFGRAAVFELAGGQSAMPSSDDIEAAAKDYR
jgi:hypothetical protein